MVGCDYLDKNFKKTPLLEEDRFVKANGVPASFRSYKYAAEILVLATK